MEIDSVLLELIRKQVPRENGLTLILGSLAEVSSLLEAFPDAVVVDDLTKPGRLARQQPHIALRSSPGALPVVDRSLGSILGVNALSRFPAPEEILPSWSRCLRDGGKLVLVERLVQSQAWRTLHRLIEPSRFWIPPEHLTCLLLNAGFSRIGQLWPMARAKAVITTGTYKVL